jgi:15-cis-phytoene synthase
MKPADYCQEKAAADGSNLYYASLFYPPQQKRLIFALFALQQELLDTVLECQDPGVARIKLKWWGEELARLDTGQARHPVSKELQDLASEFDLNMLGLLQMLASSSDEINPLPAKSLDELVKSKTRTQASSWQMTARACKCDDKQALEEIGKIAGLCLALESLKAARQHLNRGYCPFPEAEMGLHGLSHDDLLNSSGSSALMHLQRDLFSNIRTSLQQSKAILEQQGRSETLFALTMANIAEANCDILERRTGPQLSQPLSPTPLKKLWLAWRTKQKSIH